jgi:hypothetical protein
MRQHEDQAMRFATVTLAFLLVVLTCASGTAAPGDSVSVLACARPGVEANCTVITGDDGSVYNITSANPKPPLNVRIQLRGTVTDKLSACNQGLVVENITWTATQQPCGN